MEAKLNENEIGSSARKDEAWYNNKRKLAAKKAASNNSFNKE